MKLELGLSAAVALFAADQDKALACAIVNARVREEAGVYAGLGSHPELESVNPVSIRLFQLSKTGRP